LPVVGLLFALAEAETELLSKGKMDQMFKDIVYFFFRGSFVTSNRNIILFDALCRLPEGIDNKEKLFCEQKYFFFCQATQTRRQREKKTHKKTGALIRRM
jgi:hypothetical protein